MREEFIRGLRSCKTTEVLSQEISDLRKVMFNIGDSIYHEDFLPLCFYKPGSVNMYNTIIVPSNEYRHMYYSHFPYKFYNIRRSYRDRYPSLQTFEKIIFNGYSYSPVFLSNIFFLAKTARYFADYSNNLNSFVVIESEDSHRIRLSAQDTCKFNINIYYTLCIKKEFIADFTALEDMTQFNPNWFVLLVDNKFDSKDTEFKTLRGHFRKSILKPLKELNISVITTDLSGLVKYYKAPEFLLLDEIKAFEQGIKYKLKESLNKYVYDFITENS